jgi:hypothetical protein
LNVPVPAKVVTDEHGLPIEVEIVGAEGMSKIERRISNTEGFDTQRSTSGIRHSPPVSRLTSHETSTAVQRDGSTIEIRTSESGQRIADIVESWRIDDEWWRAPVSRRYFDVALDGGGHVVLFEDLMSGKWFAQQP